jgi:hypothetical protein
MSKSGYNTVEVDIEDKPMSNTVAVAEQETHVNFMRDEDFATIYTSDTTQMTRLDKLCKTSPEMYSLIADTGRGKTYRVEDKGLVSFRAKKREMSEEAKEAASQRFKDMWANRSGE